MKFKCGRRQIAVMDLARRAQPQTRQRQLQLERRLVATGAAEHRLHADQTVIVSRFVSQPQRPAGRRLR